MKTCNNCKATNPDEAAFCSECGKPLPKTEQKAVIKTMLVTPAIKSAEDFSKQASSAPSSQEKPQSSKKTILGMPMPLGGIQPKKQDEQLKPVQESAPAVSAKAAKAMPPQELDIIKAKKVAQEVAGKTMLGVSPLAGINLPQEPQTDISMAKTAFKEEQPLFEPLIQAPVKASVTPGFKPEAKPADQENIRQKKVASPQGYKIPEGAQQAPFARASLPSEEQFARPSRIGSTTMLMMRKAAAVPRWLLILIAIVIAGGVSLGYLIKKFVIEPMKPRVTKLEVYQNPNFQSVDIDLEIVNAQKAQLLQIGDLKFKVTKGISRVNLPIGPVRLGPNNIEGTLLDASGKEKGKVQLEFTLTKFWQPQTQTLEEANPVVGIYFQTLPDATLLIDNEASPGEGPGKFLYRKKIEELLSKAPPAEGDVWKVNFNYLIKRKGAQDDSGVIEIEIPAAKLQIDRPANGARVTADSIECTGKTELDALVKINGSPVDVNNGKFATTIPLPEQKVYNIEVVAISPRRGPKVVRLKVERVADLSNEVEEFMKNVSKDLTWEKLSREPANYAGKKVSMIGRLFNIKTERGVTVFQMLLSEGCPSGARCTVVVTYRGEMTLGEQSMGNVLGEVTGSETLETSTGAKFEAPRIEAAYVLPLQQEKKKKR